MSNSGVDKVLRASGYGGSTSAISNTFRGIDHRKISAPFKKNTDGQGYIFFTRPNLNLTTDNLLSNRVFSPLIRDSDLSGDLKVDDSDFYSVNTAIRVLLDSRSGEFGVRSGLIDTRYPFINLLTNTVLTLSGWPDITLDTYVSTAGMRKESWAMVDSVAETNETFTMTGTFANIEGDPITALFHYWTTYMGAVYADGLVPYPECIINNEKDYETRIWRLVPDATGRYLRKIASCIAIPLVTPSSLNLNYTRENKFANDNDQITVPFLCQMAEYNDPILYEEFNLTMGMFNPSMRDVNRESSMVKLEPNEVNYFNHEGFPRINPITLEIEWWVDKEVYVDIISDKYEPSVIKNNLLAAEGYVKDINKKSDANGVVPNAIQINPNIPLEPSPADWYRELINAKEKGLSVVEQARLIANSRNK